MTRWRSVLWGVGLALLAFRNLVGIAHLPDDPTTMTIVKWPPAFDFEVVGLPPSVTILYADENGVPGESVLLLLGHGGLPLLGLAAAAEVICRRRSQRKIAGSVRAHP